MELLNYFAMLGRLLNDLLAIFSVVAALILLFGSYSSHDLANYSLLGLFFGVLFQGSMIITHTLPGKIGMFVPMTPQVANILFGISLFLVILRYLLGLIRYRSS